MENRQHHEVGLSAILFEERLLIDQRIDDFMSEKLFGNTYEQKFEKKYECWRILFNKADTKENKKLFSLFCTQNNVCL